MNMNLDVINNFLENKNVTTVLSLLLALYAGLAAPALPNVVIKFFDTFVGKVLFIFLIAYVASRNFQVAIMLAVAFVVTLNVANKRYAEQFANLERFTGPPDEDDDDDDDDDDDEDENKDEEDSDDEDTNQNEDDSSNEDKEDSNDSSDDSDSDDEDSDEDTDDRQEVNHPNKNNMNDKQDERKQRRMRRRQMSRNRRQMRRNRRQMRRNRRRRREGFEDEVEGFSNIELFDDHEDHCGAINDQDECNNSGKCMYNEEQGMCVASDTDKDPKMEKFEGGVVPADNLQGAQSKMYAPF